jgi:hypothetical protein
MFFDLPNGIETFHRPSPQTKTPPISRRGRSSARFVTLQRTRNPSAPSQMRRRRLELKVAWLMAALYARMRAVVNTFVIAIDHNPCEPAVANVLRVAYRMPN